MTARENCTVFEDLLSRKTIDDETLTRNEEEYLNRHGSECADCSMELSMVNHLSGAADRLTFADEGEASLELAVRQDLLRTENRSLQTRLRRRNRLFAGAGIAIAVAASVLFVLFSGFRNDSYQNTMREETGTPPEILESIHHVTIKKFDGEIEFENAVPAMGDALRTGDTLKVVDGSVLLQVGEGSSVFAAKDATLSLVKADPNISHFKVNNGRVAFKVEKLTGEEQFIVDLPRGRIQVLGTLFHVSLEDGFLDVRVAKGIVHYSSDDGGGETIRSGEVLESDGSIRKMDPIEVAELNNIFDDGGPSASANSPEVAKSVAKQPKPRTQKPEATPTISELMSRAGKLRAEGRWMDLTAVYKDVVHKYPTAAEAQTCFVLLGNIQLKRVRNYPGALKSFKAYLKRSPNGSLSEEADWGIAVSYRKMGLREKEYQALEHFQKRHPGSPFTAVAKNRLMELQESADE